jgi:hypothetical protein
MCDLQRRGRRVRWGGKGGESVGARETEGEGSLLSLPLALSSLSLSPLSLHRLLLSIAHSTQHAYPILAAGAHSNHHHQYLWSAIINIPKTRAAFPNRQAAITAAFIAESVSS